MKTAYDIIIRPVITEQSMEATELKKYVFLVAESANKTEIKKAVSEIFGVKVEKVTTIRFGRLCLLRGRRIPGSRRFRPGRTALPAAGAGGRHPRVHDRQRDADGQCSHGGKHQNRQRGGLCVLFHPLRSPSRSARTQPAALAVSREAVKVMVSE